MFIYEFMGGVADTITEAVGEEEEAAVYDPHQHRKVEKPTSYSETMMHLLKGSLGAGILAMPDAFSRVGIIIGVVGMIVIGAFATYCIHLLIGVQYMLCVRHRRGYMAYPMSLQVSIEGGPPRLRGAARCLGRFLNVVLISWQLGLCCVYVVFVAENIKQMCDYYGADYNIRTHIFFLLVPTVIINIVKDLKLLTPLSSISNFVTVLGLVLTFYYMIEDDVDFDVNKFQMKEIVGVPIFVGMTLFALEAVGVVLALEYNMDQPKQFVGLFGLFNMGMLIILMLYILVGVSGYLKYGSNIKASITLNLPLQEKKAQVAKLSFAIAIFLSMPLQNFVAYYIVWDMVRKRTRPRRPWLLDYPLRVLLALLPWGMALAVPKLGPFISLFGALCLSLLALVFPALMDLCARYPADYGRFRARLWRDLAIILCGLLCLLAGCYTSVLEIIQH